MKTFLVLALFSFTAQSFGMSLLPKSWQSEPRSTQVTPRARPDSISNYTGECRITNPECANSGSRVIADMTAQCMCVDSQCFHISIGSRGPNVTRNGTGVLGSAPGSRYRTNNIVPPTTHYDNDAIRMGIPQNDSGAGISDITNGGKWIHKTGSCAPATSYSTWGCIGVECSDWPLVKNCMGCSFTVCGGAESDDEVVANSGPNRGRNRRGEYHPVLTSQQRAALRQEALSDVHMNGVVR